MPLEIPERDKRHLETLIRLPQSQVDDLYDALAHTKPVLNPAEFTASVTVGSKLDPTVVRNLVRFLINLSWVAADAGLPIDSIIDEVVRNAVEAKIAKPGPGWDPFKANLRKFLSLDDTLGVAAKALFLAHQRPCLFHSSRIFTDARPVFGTDPARSPVAFVLTHTLQIDVHTDGDDKELFIAVDTDDLVSLRNTVDRAIAKEQSLREALSKTSATVLSSSSMTGSE